MLKNASIRRLYLLAILSVLVSACRSQTNGGLESGSVKPSEINHGQPKLIKNHFYSQYPDEFFFVQCGLQDRAGNMWFGCAGDGIYRYDGKTFLNFTKNDGLSHNDVLCCLEDKSGNIWFGTRNGLIQYQPSGNIPVRSDFSNWIIAANVVDAATRQAVPYTYIPADNFVWSIFQDHRGTIWLGTNHGIYLHDPKKDRGPNGPLFTAFLDNDSLINAQHLHLKEITSINEDHDGNMYFASAFIKGEGICRFDGRHLTNFKPDGLETFRTIVVRKNGTLLFLNTFHGVYAYDGKAFTNLTRKIGMPTDTLVSLMEDRAGILWLGANRDKIDHGGEGGVWRYDGESLRRLTVEDGLSHNCVFCIVEDREGNIWFGTRNTGLCRYDGKTFMDFTD